MTLALQEFRVKDLARRLPRPFGPIIPAIRNRNAGWKVGGGKERSGDAV
jgi:hypothetical protein